jgi:hypothetical protein
LAVKIAVGTGISVQAIAALLARAGLQWVDQASGIEEQAEKLTGGKAKFGQAGRAGRLVLVGVEEAWREDEPGRFSLMSSGMKLLVNNIRVPLERTPQSRQGNALAAWDAPVMTIINLSKVRLSFLDRVREELLTPIWHLPPRDRT